MRWKAYLSLIGSVLIATAASADPLSAGAYLGTVKFLASAPAGCPSDICGSAYIARFSLRQSGRKWRFKSTYFSGLLSRGSNGLYSGYVGTGTIGLCSVNEYAYVGGLKRTGRIYAGYILQFFCPGGDFGASYSGNVRKVN